MAHLTIYKNDLSKPNGRFIMWSNHPTFRRWFFHTFLSTHDARRYFTIHFLGFVAAGSFKAVR